MNQAAIDYHNGLFPLVSVVMPISRPWELNRAMSIFHSQTYPNKELIIVEDSGVPYEAVINGSRIVQVISGKKLVGEKRNMGCEHASGEIIVHQDSDDWYRPDWVTLSVKHLINSGADLTGLNTGYFFRYPSNMWKWNAEKQYKYVCEASMCYWKDTWKRFKFPIVKSGEGGTFCLNAGTVSIHQNIDSFMAMIHAHNTTGHRQTAYMERINPEIAQRLLGESYNLFI